MTVREIVETVETVDDHVRALRCQSLRDPAPIPSAPPWG